MYSKVDQKNYPANFLCHFRLHPGAEPLGALQTLVQSKSWTKLYFISSAPSDTFDVGGNTYRRVQGRWTGIHPTPQKQLEGDRYRRSADLYTQLFLSFCGWSQLSGPLRLSPVSDQAVRVVPLKLAKGYFCFST